MVDVSGDRRSFTEILLSMRTSQSIMQARWADESPLLTLPHITRALLPRFKISKHGGKVRNEELLSQLINTCNGKKEVLEGMLQIDLNPTQIQEIWDALGKLPLLNIDVSISDGPSQTATNMRGTKRLPKSSHKEEIERTVTTTAQANQEYTLHVNLRQLNKGAKRVSYTPRYPQRKEVRWWLVLGKTSSNSLLSWKRIDHVFGRTFVDLPFQMPQRKGTILCSLHVVSDCYLGLDSEIRIPFELKPAAMAISAK
eukprot:XP_011670117.1 PREDICTED: activating signal cointegrator 1 complex subunit 3-like [Strongylocentrotus purpuratus]